MNIMVLEPQANESNGEDVIRRCLIQRMNDDMLVSQDELWFQFPLSITPPESTDCDSYLLAMVMDAMREGRKLVVKGTVSQALLSNLTEFQGAWHKWLPNLYNQVDMEVDVARTGEEPLQGAVCAFSGGVDGTFTVWRHSQKRVGYRSQDIKLCILVHGFDIPLEEIKAFENAYLRANATLADVNLQALPVRTNFKEISRSNWEHAFAAALVAALSNCKQIVGTGLVGSSEPYDHLVIPWGSTPITDHLLSSGPFKIMHDGATHSRTEKVSEIVEWQKGTENLRVCWEGDLKDRNCGICEKCLRTKMNFLAVGSQIPKCFPGQHYEIILPFKIIIKSRAALAEWNQLIQYAKIKNVKGRWIKKAQWILWKNATINNIQWNYDHLKVLARKMKSIISSV